ncbi:transglycosylase [Novosphingobium sp. CF614]|uniref:transglycosylase n=1 Tax=Novosphingobium sp. CF614 TaxID=1884364 RepID=UPI000B805634
MGGAAATRGSQARAAIARASEATGVDFQYLLAQAKLESSLDPSARAATSSAAGLYQFTQGTWLETLDRHGSSHGMAWVNDAIQGGRISDPRLRAQVMGLRYDADTSAMMAAELASDNKAELTAQLGREPDASELYLAHFLGSSGASQFLSALATDPSQSAAAILPKAAAANRSIFYAGGAPRSVGAVMDLMRSKVSGAMESGDAALWASAGGARDISGAPAEQEAPGYQAAAWQPPMGPIAREFHAGLPSTAQAPQVATRSMADTLRGTFGTSAEAAPAHVRDAYAKLARFNL